MEIKKIAIEVAALSVIVVVVASAVAFVLGYRGFALALSVGLPFGLVALASMAKNVSAVFKDDSSKLIKIVVNFIFRLACFAILLYVLLVRLSLNPLGVAFGITLPVFCAMAVMFRWAHRLSDKNTEK